MSTQSSQAAVARKKPVSSESHPTLNVTGQAMDPKESIRARAYQIYEQRGREEGHADEDWLQAEIEVLGKSSDVAA